MAPEHKVVLEELRGQLEALGMAPPLAERMARAQAEGASRTEAAEPAQHVLPVSRGWVVMRSYASLDAERFATRAEALERAIALAREAGSSVVVHDANGEVEQRLDFESQ